MKYPKLLYTAKSIIEREALTAHLESESIVSHSPARDMSRKFTAGTMDLSLGGYSLFFDGFKVYVEESDFRLAEASLSEFLSSYEKNDSDYKTSKSHINKFFFFGFASLIIPVIPLFFGLYFLFKALKSNEKINKPYFFFSLILYSVNFLYLYRGVQKIYTFLIH